MTTLSDVGKSCEGSNPKAARPPRLEPTQGHVLSIGTTEGTRHAIIGSAAWGYMTVFTATGDPAEQARARSRPLPEQRTNGVPHDDRNDDVRHKDQEDQST
jgi:hypothetical protein